jgi:hypothetical protein
LRPLFEITVCAELTLRSYTFVGSRKTKNSLAASSSDVTLHPLFETHLS